MSRVPPLSEEEQKQRTKHLIAAINDADHSIGNKLVEGVMDIGATVGMVLTVLQGLDAKLFDLVMRARHMGSEEIAWLLEEVELDYPLLEKLWSAYLQKLAGSSHKEYFLKTLLDLWETRPDLTSHILLATLKPLGGENSQTVRLFRKLLGNPEYAQAFLKLHDAEED